ncbi:bifunctional 2-polyprenyl-6-hydroxyphenol methylase/3-demethylubiquinol 3-O-methyltransferase UbiG [Cellulomonas sp. PhB150]|uniref:class I SAM-dependent methyltransferase n=1 Tax=Cellulomonas sp. PhB150 TaxID=2485188 RepID=UPI000F493276|nr:class I SAM-dependent methyltransferase [Cellulomonas sp. PhB150]ROS23062.1 2-polyprenyl-3-methyl-5-hydroxy-6-metoxy-1,4-benzoquinol methylase [Cellulomonas sp. PhB150]
MSSDLFEPVGHGADAVADRLMAATLGAQELFAVYVGERLGWYAALAARGPTTSAELASSTGTDERYAREWLEHQAVSGYVTVDGEHRFVLTDGAREVLTDADSPLYLAPLGRLQAASGRVVDDLVEAYRAGGGVSWQQMGDDARTSQGALNRPFFLGALVDDVLPSIPVLHELLQRGAKVADLGCGEGWSSIAVARAYPRATVVGIDIDAPSIETAQRNAVRIGVEVAFELADASSARHDEFDVVMFFECVHDMADPVAVLAAARAMVRDDGYVLVADERTEEVFTAPAGPVERLLYGWSLTVCLPDGRSASPSVATGTVMRPAVLDGYARAAGFAGIEILPIEHDMLRFYRLLTA